MYHSQVNEFKYEIERLNRTLQEVKLKYYKLRKWALSAQKQGGQAKIEVNRVNYNNNQETKFLGAGFKLSKAVELPSIAIE